MKRIVLLILLLSAITTFSCSHKDNNDNSARFRIVASFYPIYIMAKNITAGLSDVSVKSLAPQISGCLHDYTVSANDMIALENASVFVINGAGMESFMEKVALQYKNLPLIDLSKGADLISEETGPNPHIWVSVDGAIAQVHTLTDSLAEMDPVNADTYHANAEKYLTKLEALRKDMHAKLDRYKGKKIITFHEAFPYFARDFGLTIATVIEREPGSEPSAKELAQTIETVKRSKIRALFTEPQYPSRAAETIARATGSKVYILDPAVTGPDSPDSYIEIMSRNALTLEEALK